MDNFNDCFEEKDLEQTQALNQLLLEMIKNQKATAKRIITVFITTIICYTAILIAMVIGFFVYESQFEVVEEVITEETITQEVSGEGSEINNIEGNMYRDNSVHNEK